MREVSTDKAEPGTPIKLRINKPVLIEGPAANITIRGQADLRNQQFDQTIDVNPRAGNLLTVVGAVAGGPVGAALGAATNAVLSKP